MNRTTVFSFGAEGVWDVVSVSRIAGDDVTGAAGRMTIGVASEPLAPSLALRGVASNVRYATAAERAELIAVQEGLGRPGATRAALIPISKNEIWWGLAQDQRRAIFEEASRHHSIGVAYLPQIARKLYHARDIGEPFDFLTWFEYAPEDEGMFDDLVETLRATPEWKYVSREIDIRLTRAG